VPPGRRPVRAALLAVPLAVGLVAAPAPPSTDTVTTDTELIGPDSAVPEDTPSDILVSGPLVASSKKAVEPGGRTTLTIGGFTSPWVQISICGNEARRGSADCGTDTSEGVEVSRSEPLTIAMPVAAPPADCPCVIRVVGQNADEVAHTPIEVIGHPVSPLTDPPLIGEVVAVSITATELFTGALDALRSDLGGRTSYEVTVRVRNLANTPLKRVNLSASAGGGEGDDSVARVDVDDPGLIGVGQTWQQTVVVELPAPAFGSTEWRAVASGAGPSVIATSATEHRPWLLIAAAAALVVIVWMLFVRWRMRRRAARSDAGELRGMDELHTSEGGPPTVPVEPVSAREPVDAVRA
jgi:hypothetical protein